MPNATGTAPHIADFGLIQFADGEMPVTDVTATETHLRTCSKCQARLNQLRSGAHAYDQYHAQILKPSLEVPEVWPGLQSQLEATEVPRRRFLPPTRSIRWAAGAVLACCLFGAAWLLSHRETPARRMQQVLAQAVARPTGLHRRLHVTANGHGWYRAASLQGEQVGRSVEDQHNIEQTRALFVKADYDWDNPLNARSFASWRKQLPEKRDQVLAIQDGDRRFYRLQTETSASVLRTAVLTMRADTLSPVKGDFRFEGRNDVTIYDAGEMGELTGEVRTNENRPIKRPVVVREAGPEEELRVIGALSAIGADVGEPVTVKIDGSKQQIVVTGVGLSPNRERQLRQALAPIPNTATHFMSGQPPGDRGRPVKAGALSPVNGAPLRHELETQAGGAEQFQAITDAALDASSVLLAQANALHVLAEKFPSPIAATFAAADRETLRALRHRHAVAIEQATAELNDALRPLFRSANIGTDETRSQPTTSWEIGAARLVEQARQLDDSLGRVLAGNYPEETGRVILGKLPDEIQTLEALARSQENVRQ